MPHRVQIPFPRLHGPLCMVCATMPEAERRMRSWCSMHEASWAPNPVGFVISPRPETSIGLGHGNIQAGNYMCAAKEGYPCQQSKMTKNDRAFTA
jgi:hypothetical protein